MTVVVVLAAGAGTRMRSSRPKVLHAIGGRSLLEHGMRAARGLEPESLVVVVGHGRDQVVAELAAIDPAAVVAVQEHQRGTGDALAVGLAAVTRPTASTAPGTVVVTYADTPLLTAETLQSLVAAHERSGAAVTVLTADVADPTGYGRIVRGTDGAVAGIVEQRDADDAQRAITEINSGFYAFDRAALPGLLSELRSDNAAGEVYLTDTVAGAVAAGLAVATVTVADTWQVRGVNDRVQLAELGAELNRRTVYAWMRAGVTVVDPATTWIDADVVLAEDVTLAPNTQLHGACVVGVGASIGPDTTLTAVEVGAGASVVRTHGSGAVLGAGATVGPYAYLRPGTRLGVAGKIGTFVETKNAVIGDGSKVPHLSYVGDATIGTGTNIGASSVFVNYDGISKNRTTIGDHCRTGSDTKFVAPVTVGDGAYTGAGTVVRRNVPPGALAVSTGPQRNLEGWVGRARPGSAAAEAADRAERARHAERIRAEEAAAAAADVAAPERDPE
jgi:bifunctional UDP-N-acetylglucosamine pyrophosphorylase/glucosamine-1-phosphate N-acetyltransferase